MAIHPQNPILLTAHEIGTEIQKCKQIPKVTQLAEENQIFPTG